MKSIDIYLAKISKEHASEVFYKYKDHFDEKRVQRIMRAKNDKAKAELIYSGAVLSYVLKERGIESKINYQKNGKPYLENSDVYFNISHSGDMVALGIADFEIGVDIQKAVEFKEVLRKRLVCPEHEEKYESLYKDHFNLAFAIKESFSKLSGEGILTEFNKIYFEIENKDIKIFEGGKFAAFACNAYSDSGYELVVSAKEKFLANEPKWLDL